MPTHSLACQLVVRQHSEGGGLEGRKGDWCLLFKRRPCFSPEAAGPSLLPGAHGHSPPPNLPWFGVPKAEPVVDPGNSGNQWTEVVSFRGWEEEIDLGPRHNHLTSPLLPVVGTPEREEGRTMREQDVGHTSALAEQGQ